MFCNANRDVARHIISFLPLEDWVSIQKVAKIFRSLRGSPSEILERKRLYFNKCIKVTITEDNADVSAQIRNTIASFKALIKHIDLFKLLLSSRRYSRRYQKTLAAVKNACDGNLKYATSCVRGDDDVDTDSDVYIMWRVLLEWKEIEASVDAVLLKKQTVEKKPIVRPTLISYPLNLLPDDDDMVSFHCKFCDSDVHTHTAWQDLEGHGDEGMGYHCPHCDSGSCAGDNGCDRFVRKGCKQCKKCSQ